MENKKLNPKKFLSLRIPDFAKLYLVQLSIAIFIWFINNLFLKETISEVIQTASEDFPVLVIYTEPWYQILMRSFLIILIIYALIFVISTLTTPIVGKILYVFLVVGVALAAGTSFSGGILNYNWGNGIFQVLISQLEWLGGALVISSDKDRYILGKTVLFGIISVLISVILRVLLL